MDNKKLSKSMSVEQFERGYWYAVELKAFAKEIGIPGTAKLRKDELETAIKDFLKSGKVQPQTPPSNKTSATKDTDRGLSLDLAVVYYIDNRETKAFIDEHAARLDRCFKKKSGARYRLNRWRESQLAAGKSITYGDLVGEYIRLCGTDGRFEQAPTGRYINFLSDYLREKPDASREEAIQAWHQLKQLDIKKDYSSWVAYQRRIANG